MPSAGEIAEALIRLADAADRAVFVLEAWSVAVGVVDPEDVGMVMRKPSPGAESLLED